MICNLVENYLIVLTNFACHTNKELIKFIFICKLILQKSVMVTANINGILMDVRS